MNSDNSDKWGSIGTDDPVLQLIRQFYPSYPNGPLGDLTTDPLVALTAIRVEQERDSTIVSDSSESSSNDTASYYAEKYTVTANGPRVTDDTGTLVEPDNVDGKRIDTGAVYNEWDLRGFGDDIKLAWKESARTHRDIKYRSSDAPVAGIPAETRYVWLWRADSATSDPTVYLEGWS